MLSIARRVPVRSVRAQSSRFFAVQSVNSTSEYTQAVDGDGLVVAYYTAVKQANMVTYVADVVMTGVVPPMQDDLAGILPAV